MSIGVTDFWRLVEQSRLLATEQCQHLDAEFRALANGNADNSKALTDWLVSRNVFSRYQAAVLLAGRPGPFVYGDYRIYDRVEGGRLSGQFRAVHSGTGHPVILQFIGGATASDPQLWMAAASEAQLSCSIVHPYVQRYFELVDLGSFKFLVSEDVRGETLEERLAVGRFAPHEACRLSRMAALALAVMHASGRAHGDLRPANVWLEPASPHHPGIIKLLRDPLAAPQPPNLAYEDPQGKLLAQSDYFAPELQFPGKKPDVLTDLYALGCTLYHMLAGHPPFPGGNTQQKMARHSAEAIRPLEAYGVPQPVAQLVTFLMAKNPALRYQDANTVADQLAVFVDPNVIQIPVPPSLPTLASYKVAIQQSHAQLHSQPYGAASPPPYVGAAPTIAAEPPAPSAPIQTGVIPKGKAVGAAISAAPVPVSAPAAEEGEDKPTIVFKNTAKKKKSSTAANPTDPKVIAAKEAQQRVKLIAILCSVGVAAVLLIVGVNMLGRKGNDELTSNGDPENIAPENVVPTKVVEPDVPPDPMVETPVTPPVNTNTNVGYPQPKSLAETPIVEVVADDGKLPWASPTSGKAIDFKYVPPQPGTFIIVRGADLAESPQGPKTLQALGPQVQGMLADWEKASGFKLGEVEQLIVTLHGNDTSFPRVATVVRPKQDLSLIDLVAKWGAPSESKTEQGVYYSGAGGWCYFAPAEESGDVFVMGDETLIKGVMAEPIPLLAPELSRLRKVSDDKRHVTVFFYPNFLFSESGDPLFTGERARVKEPLTWLLGDGLKAGLLSMQFGETFYYEMRFVANVDREPHMLAAEFRKRLEQIPAAIEKYNLVLNPPPYWKTLSNRFPAMIDELHTNMRVGVEENQAVINAVLPGPAGHNLVLGTELVMSTAPGAVTTVAGTPNKKGPQTIQEVMDVKMNEFSFDSLSLEVAVENLAKDARDLITGSPIDFQMRILGDDFLKEGLTRNQSVANFKQSSKTVGQVLTELCMVADPTAATDPAQVEQRMMWVIEKDPVDGKEKVLLTTRAAATANKYKFPAVFQAKK